MARAGDTPSRESGGCVTDHYSSQVNDEWQYANYVSGWSMIRTCQVHDPVAREPCAAAQPTTCPQARRVKGGNYLWAFRRARPVVKQASQEGRKTEETTTDMGDSQAQNLISSRVSKAVRLITP
jgi:hypothetical protein